MDYLKKPQVFNPANGLFANNHFQMAYATNDIERAKQLLQGRYHIKHFQKLQGQTPAGGTIHVELAWAGSLMLELITAAGPGAELFMHQLPDQAFSIRHHHLGYLIGSEKDWQALQTLIKNNGYRLLSENNNQGFMRHCFIDAPELGHYLEFIFPEPAGLEFLNNVPAN